MLVHWLLQQPVSFHIIRGVQSQVRNVCSNFRWKINWHVVHSLRGNFIEQWSIAQTKRSHADAPTVALFPLDLKLLANKIETTEEGLPEKIVRSYHTMPNQKILLVFSQKIFRDSPEDEETPLTHQNYQERLTQIQIRAVAT